MNTLLISHSDILNVMQYVHISKFMDEVIENLEDAFVKYNQKFVNLKKRDGFIFSEPYPSLIEWMPICYDRQATIKIVSYNPYNPKLHNIPTIVSTISLLDVETGHLVALADGIFLTAVRTGAASAIASKILAHQKSETIGLVGCGSQAVTQLHALSRIFSIKNVYAYDIDKEAALSFLERSSFLKLNVKLVSRSILEQEADIICTATTVPIGCGPVIEDKNLKSHIHVNSIGSDLPGKIELPVSLLKRSFVCPDFLPQAIIEGECQQLESNDIGPSIIEISKNREKYNSFRDKPTVFDSTGFALEDQVAMKVLLKYINKFNLGKKLEIESLGYDPKNPYDFLKIGLNTTVKSLD